MRFLLQQLMTTSRANNTSKENFDPLTHRSEETPCRQKNNPHAASITTQAFESTTKGLECVPSTVYSETDEKLNII